MSSSGDACGFLVEVLAKDDNGSGVQFSLLLLSPVPGPGTSEKLGRIGRIRKIPASL